MPISADASFGLDLQFTDDSHGMPEVMALQEGTVAGAADGLLTGDVISHVNGVETIRGRQALYAAMADARAHSHLVLTVRRRPPVDLTLEIEADERLSGLGYDEEIDVVLAVPPGGEWSMGLNVEYDDEVHGMPVITETIESGLAGGCGHVLVGDVLTHVNGIGTYSGLESIRYAVGCARRFERLTLTLRRKTAESAERAAMARLASCGGGAPFEVVLGVPTSDISLGFDLEYIDTTHGMPEVIHLATGGLADRCGQLRIGDVLTHVNGHDTSPGPQALCDAIDAARNGRSLSLTIRRRRGANGDAQKESHEAAKARAASAAFAWLESEVDKSHEEDEMVEMIAGQRGASTTCLQAARRTAAQARRAWAAPRAPAAAPPPPRLAASEAHRWLSSAVRRPRRRRR